MSSRTLTIPTAEVFEPLLEPARYKGAHGGRGSGKSHFFAGLLIEDSLANPGLRSVCIREVQKSLKESAKRLIEDKLAQFELGSADGFKVWREVIETPGDGLIAFQGMQDHTAESIKSLEGFGRAWVEEAQTLSSTSLSLLRPTIRAPGSELWFSWNPRRRNDPVDLMLRGEGKPTGAKVVEANWSHNPWLPAELDQERLDCLSNEPDQYDHIWQGGYATVLTGAYYAKALAEAKTAGRIGKVAKEPLMTVRAIWDIGGTGAKADACSIWIAQFVGQSIYALDYYEAVGQPLATHVQWLRDNGYGDALCILPHDGANNDKVYDVSYESALKEAGFEVIVVPNQGKGAAKMRIEAGRRLFPRVWFNEATTEAGRAALGWYHEKQDEARNIGLGPEHDWSSHGCFLGGTEVLTRYGTCQIMNLPKTGEILTPCGWKQYVHPRITKRAAPLVEVEFTGGYSVKCTPDHLFLTASGWKSAESLTPNTEILSTLTRSRSISMAASTACGRARSICLAAASAFTGMCGRLLSGPFQADAISTTGTETYSTIGWRTWSACQLPSTFPSHGRSGSSLRTDGFQRLLETRPPSGIGPQRGGCGTSGTQGAPRAGRNGSAKRSPASIAESCIWRWFARVAIRASSALRRARSRLIESVGSRTNTRVAIANVRQLNETADVWDITVPDGHCFSLANGAVVHNSDAFGLMCVAYETPKEQSDIAGRLLGGSGRSGSWMGG